MRKLKYYIDHEGLKEQVSPSGFGIIQESQHERNDLFSLNLLLDIAGISACRVGEDSDADLIYTPKTSELAVKSGRIVVPHDLVPAQKDTLVRLKLGWQSNIPYFYHSVVGDIVHSTMNYYCAFRSSSVEKIITDARTGKPFDTRNAVANSFLGLPLEEVLRIPVLSLYASELRRLAVSLGFDVAPMYPDGKKYAIVLMHDVLMDVPQPALSFLDAIKRSIFIEKDSQYGTKFDQYFNTWMDFERNLGICSCFFIAARNSADRYANEAYIKYDLADSGLVKNASAAIQNGWEAGLLCSPIASSYFEDPSILSSQYHFVYPFIEEGNRFSKFIRRISQSDIPGRGESEETAQKHCLAPLGVRHVDYSRHEGWTLLFEEAGTVESLGFRYDISSEFSDGLCFRKGLCHPYVPQDLCDRKPLIGRAAADITSDEQLPDFLFIPATCTDQAFKKYVQVPGGIEQAFGDYLRTIFNCNGVAAININLENCTAENGHGIGPVLIDLLRKYRAADENIWWATPGELYEWWQRRRAILR